MTLERVAAICFCIAITSEAATGQQRSDTAQGQKEPASTVMERVAGDFGRWRRVETRNESGSREVVVETFEVPNPEGRLAPSRETVIETRRTAPGTAQSRREVFTFAQDGRRTLVEATESLSNTRANGDSSTIHNTSAPDLNGRLGLTSRQIEETRSSSTDVRETRITLLRPDPNDTLRAAERTEYTERVVNPGLVLHDSTHLLRDINGRWQAIEARRGEVREMGASEGIQEETIQRLDINGKLAVDERTVSRRSYANGQEQVVIEIQAPYADGSSALALSQRVHRTTTATADGGRHIVEEVESRNPVAPSDPMRVTRRIVTTVRHIGADRWVTERQVFERDVNDRLRLVTTDTEDSVAR